MVQIITEHSRNS